MSNKDQTEQKPATSERRPYTPPTVEDFFQPVVMLGTTALQLGCGEAHPKVPKR